MRNTADFPKPHGSHFRFFFFGLPHHAWKSERTGKNVLQNFHEALQSGFVITVSPNSYCILWVSYFSKKTISCLDNLSDSEMCLLFWHRLSSCVMPSTLARCKVKFTNCMWSKIKIRNLSMLNYMVKRSLCALSLNFKTSSWSSGASDTFWSLM